MIRHYLPKKEILAMPAGRILDTLVREYVFGEYPQVWQSSKQTFRQASWFEEKPRQIAEDDLMEVAVEVPHYSTREDDSNAVINKMLEDGLLVGVEKKRSTYTVTVLNKSGHILCEVSANSKPLALCRAALYVGSIAR